MRIWTIFNCEATYLEVIDDIETKDKEDGMTRRVSRWNNTKDCIIIS